MLNVFFVRALADRLPRDAPIVVTAVNPGYCVSELRRNVTSLAMRIRFVIMDILLARTEEGGALQLVWAALGPDGKSGSHEHYMNGAYVSTLTVKEPSDFVISKEGREAQDRIWVRDLPLDFRDPMKADAHMILQDETIEILSRATLQLNESGALFNPAEFV